MTFVSRVAVMGLGLFWMFALAGLLDPDGRGSYAVASQFAAILTVIFMLGADAGACYFVGARKMSPSEGAMAVLVYSLAGSALAIVAGCFLMRTNWEYFRKADASSFYLALASIPLSFYGGALVNLLVSLGEFMWFAIVTLAQILLSIALLLVYVGVFGLGVNGALLTLITVNVLTVGGMWVLLRRRHGLRWAWPSRRVLGQVMSFGLRYYFGKVSNVVNFQLGTLVLAFFASQTQANIGLFAFGLMLVDSVQFLPDTLSTVLMPRVFVDAGGRVELVTQCNRIITVVCGVALVGVFFMAPVLIALFVPKYREAVPLIWILIPGVLVRCASKLMVPYLQSQNRVGIASVATVAGVVVNIAVLWFLLPVLGLPAAALAVVASYVVLSGVLAVAFHRCSGLGFWESWRPRWSDVTWLRQSTAGYVGRLRGK